MKLTRRRFCQLTLVSTILTTLPVSAENRLPLRPEFKVDLVEGKLRTELSLENLDSKAIEVQTSGGPLWGVSLSVLSDNDQKPLRLTKTTETPEERMALISRVGPRPRWVTLKPGEKKRIGNFVSTTTLPGDFDKIRLALILNTRKGQMEFPQISQRISRS